MNEKLLSFLIWILLPALLLGVSIVMGGNVLAIILILVWFGFGAMIYSPSEES